MGKSLSFNNGVFTLTVDHIEHGRGRITLAMNAPLTVWANSGTVLDALRDMGSSAAGLGYNYYLREMIKEEIKATEDNVEPSEQEEGEHVETV